MLTTERKLIFIILSLALGLEQNSCLASDEVSATTRQNKREILKARRKQQRGRERLLKKCGMICAISIPLIAFGLAAMLKKANRRGIFINKEEPEPNEGENNLALPVELRGMIASYVGFGQRGTDGYLALRGVNKWWKWFYKYHLPKELLDELQAKMREEIHQLKLPLVGEPPMEGSLYEIRNKGLPPFLRIRGRIYTESYYAAPHWKCWTWTKASRGFCLSSDHKHMLMIKREQEELNQSFQISIINLAEADPLQLSSFNLEDIEPNSIKKADFDAKSGSLMIVSSTNDGELTGKTKISLLSPTKGKKDIELKGGEILESLCSKFGSISNEPCFVTRKQNGNNNERKNRYNEQFFINDFEGKSTLLLDCDCYNGRSGSICINEKTGLIAAISWVGNVQKKGVKSGGSPLGIRVFDTRKSEKHPFWIRLFYRSKSKKHPCGTLHIGDCAVLESIKFNEDGTKLVVLGYDCAKPAGGDSRSRVYLFDVVSYKQLSSFYTDEKNVHWGSIEKMHDGVITIKVDNVPEEVLYRFFKIPDETIGNNAKS